MAEGKHQVRLAVTPAEGTAEDGANVVEQIRSTLADYGVDVAVSQDGATFHLDVDVDAMEALSSAVGWVLATGREALGV